MQWDNGIKNVYHKFHKQQNIHRNKAYRRPLKTVCTPKNIKRHDSIYDILTSSVSAAGDITNIYANRRVERFLDYRISIIIAKLIEF